MRRLAGLSGCAGQCWWKIGEGDEKALTVERETTSPGCNSRGEDGRGGPASIGMLESKDIAKRSLTLATIRTRWTLINPPASTFIDVAYGNPFYQCVETAVSKGVVSGYSDHTFRPSNDATTGQIAKINCLAVTMP